MAGIYVHFPFCKSRCIYCGFYSTTSVGASDEYVSAVCTELERAEWKYRDISTIYFGGGTPSQLHIQHLKTVRDCIYTLYNVSQDVEFTVEVNPDDVAETYLDGLRSIGVNRLSMGMQTFDDVRLRFLRRRHTSVQALEAVTLAKKAGFDNISVDLMFGFPGQTPEEWRRDVETAVSLGVQHISAYSLMYEEGTALLRMLERGEIEEVSDETSLRMFELLMNMLEENGYVHYEISNWAKPGFRSRHNSSYWNDVPYLGVGAAAHSYDCAVRWYNPSSLSEYIAFWSQENARGGRIVEPLSVSDKYDEYVMTGLRTCEGLELAELERRFGADYYFYCLKNADAHIRSGRLENANGRLRLTKSGIFVSNDVMSDLMYIP